MDLRVGSNGCPNRDYPISQMRIVKVSILAPGRRAQGDRYDENPMIRYMHESQVDTFMRATIQLHHIRGNPHKRDNNGNHIECKLDNLWEISVAKFSTQTVSYWHCAESLRAGDPLGAKLNETTFFERIWAHQDLILQEEKDIAAAERAEYLAEVGE